MEPLHEALRLIKRQTELIGKRHAAAGRDSGHGRARALSASARTRPISRGGHRHSRNGGADETASRYDIG